MTLDGVTLDGDEKLSDVKLSTRGLFGGQLICAEGLCIEEDEESDLE